MTILIFLGTLITTMAIGVPVAFALIFCGLVLMAWMGITDPQIVAANMVAGADNFTLLAVPFFLLAGEVMNVGGLSRRIVAFAVTCVGHMRGGLGAVTILAAVIMASLSGSPSADTAALAAILIPMMREAGHDVPRAAGPDGLGRHHRPGDPAVHRLHHLRSRGQRLDHGTVPGGVSCRA